MPPKKQKSAKIPDSGHSALSAHYAGLVAEGKLKDDPAQHTVLTALEKLNEHLANPPSAVLGFFKKPAKKQSGLYIWGNVGRGKSMLMDLFFTHAAPEKKRRVHFHAFMQEVHGRMHAIRQDTRTSGDHVSRLVQQIAAETSLLCFDELQATDVADATLLYRLFSGLFDAGITIVSTSNHPPASLYTGGVQRERFDRFISLIEEKMEVIALSSPLDYRTMQIKSFEKRYCYPLSESNDFAASVLHRLCPNAKPQQKTLDVNGRSLRYTAYHDMIGLCSFHDLCESPLGAADYLALAKACDTLILTGIPKLNATKRNEAKRFTTLIDALYEQKVKLLCTAETPPEEIYTEGDGAFEFKRTVSRLAEMQSVNWGHDG